MICWFWIKYLEITVLIGPTVNLITDQCCCNIMAPIVHERARGWVGGSVALKSSRGCEANDVQPCGSNAIMAAMKSPYHDICCFDVASCYSGAFHSSIDFHSSRRHFKFAQPTRRVDNIWSSKSVNCTLRDCIFTNYSNHSYELEKSMCVCA